MKFSSLEPSTPPCRKCEVSIDDARITGTWIRGDQASPSWSIRTVELRVYAGGASVNVPFVHNYTESAEMNEPIPQPGLPEVALWEKATMHTIDSSNETYFVPLAIME